MDLPSINDFAVLHYVEMRMLSCGEARMIRQNSEAVSDFNAAEVVALPRFDLTMLL